VTSILKTSHRREHAEVNVLRAEDVIAIFRETGALLEGHFILSSGLHSGTYLQCAIALAAPVVAGEFGMAIAQEFRDRQIETVASPAIGGLVIGYEVARQLGARFIWTERKAGRMTLRRGFRVREGERVLVVEDVMTTGGSTRETIATLREAGAEVVGAASIIDRSGGKANVGVPRISLATLEVPAVEPAICKACARGEIGVKPGSSPNAPTV
jgi:orotate phosphoribosyltransferase